MKKLGTLAASLLGVLCAGPAAVEAQESRATLVGTVADETGAAMPEATVLVTHVATGTTTRLVTAAGGQYAALYLLPGAYTVAAEKPGFKTALHENVQLRVGDKVELDFKLSPSAVAEEIEVVATRPLLDTGSGTYAQLIDSTLITQLPLGDGTAYSLARLVPGTTFEGGYALQRPMDNGNLFNERVGGVGRSEYTLDGSSNVVNVSGSPAMGISPPAEAIEEFKFETAAYDAQLGHTGGGLVNLALKSGGNQFHAATYYFNRDDSRSANDFASNRAGVGKAPRNYYRFGTTVSGPVIKNKTFFVASYEKLADIRSEPFTHTVPTERMRNGDFSELLPSVVIYDPATARLVNGVVVRDPFPGNVIPAHRLNPVARNVLGYYPLPNQPGAADRSQNYFVQQPWDYTYDYQMLKLDHAWSPDHRSYLRFTRNWRDEERGDFAGVQQGVEISRGIDSRYNYNVALGHTTVFSPTLVLDVKASALRFASWQRPAAELDLADLGFSSQTVALTDGYSYLPRFNINSYVTMGTSTTTFGAPRKIPFYNYSANPTLTKISGSHTLRLGYDFRMLRENRLDEAFKGGQYTFDGAWTRPASTAPTQLGHQLAQFLLGLPTNGTMDLAASRANEVVAHGIFIQDDWRVSPRLTLNLGLRYDYEQPMTERYQRNTRGFDLAASSPIEAQARQNYARNPIPQLPVDSFQVKGGYAFATEDERGFWKPVLDNIQPRLGFSFKADPKTVVRGGGGLFVPLFEISSLSTFALNQTGYSRSTSMNITQNNGLTFNTDLTSPFPGGLLQPIGSSQGLATNLGNNVGAFVPLERDNPEIWRFSLGVQRELPARMVMELTYVGQRGRNLVTTDNTTNNINFIPAQFLATGRTRDAAVETLLGQTVPNPFQGLLPDAPGVNGATITRGRLLTPYPQFGTLFQEGYDGSSTYDALLVRLEKRFGGGTFFMTNYTYSRLKEKINRLNPGGDFEERRSAIDRPHRFVAAGVMQLPLGRDRHWGRGWGGLADGILGGWQLTFDYQFQSGEPLAWGNLYWDESCGDPRGLKATWGHDSSGRKLGIDVPAFDTSCFYFHDPAVQTAGRDDPAKQRADTRIALTGNNVRYFPSTLPDFRGANHHSLDVGLGKTFRLGKGARLEIRAEVLNALNYTIFRNSTLDLNPRNATFGTFTGSGQPTVVMLPRDIQLGTRLTF